MDRPPGNHIWEFLMPLHPRFSAENLGDYCSFGSDCMCAEVHGKPDPNCAHHRRTTHDDSESETEEQDRPARHDTEPALNCAA